MLPLTSTINQRYLHLANLMASSSSSSKTMAPPILLILLLTSATLPHTALSRHHSPAVNLPPSTGGGTGLLPWTNPSPSKCSFKLLDLGLCLDVLGGLVHVGFGDAVENHCCPVLEGLLELEAAVCLCTAIKLRLLNLDIYIPLSLQVLITCGKGPPPGWVCPLN